LITTLYAMAAIIIAYAYIPKGGPTLTTDPKA
jgi:hypothetical protein